MSLKDKISFEDFKKLDIQIGKILSAERVENSDRLLKLRVSFGKEERQIIAGISEFYQPESLRGKLCPFIFNLEEKTIKGLQSQGMILAADSNSKPVLLHPDKEVEPGVIIK